MAHVQVCFKGFSADTAVERADLIKSFMASHFPGNSSSGEYIACIDTRMRGPWGSRTMSDESFVQFFTSEARERVMKAIIDGKLASNLASVKGAKLSVGRMRTDVHRSRDFAMRKAEELIRQKLSSKSVSLEGVKYEKTKESRKIVVNEQDAFVQERGNSFGAFAGEFTDLSLP